MSWSVPIPDPRSRPRPPTSEPRLTFGGFVRLVGRTPTLLCLLGAFMCANFVAVVLLSWMPKFLFDKFHMGLAMAGLTATIFVQLASMAGAPVGGWLADAWRRRSPRGRMAVQAIGMFGGAPFVVLCGLTQSVGTLIVALTLWGLFKGLYDANIFASVFDVVPPAARGRAAGFMNMIGWLAGGGIRATRHRSGRRPIQPRRRDGAGVRGVCCRGPVAGGRDDASPQRTPSPNRAAMKSLVEFKSAVFPADESESTTINPGRYGRRVAEYLKRRLPEFGIATGSVAPEDWGWALSTEFPEIWIGCGNHEEHPDGFLCFVEPKNGFVKKWFFMTRDVSADHQRVADALDRVLRSDPEIRDVRWWSDQEAG